MYLKNSVVLHSQQMSVYFLEICFAIEQAFEQQQNVGLRFQELLLMLSLRS